MRPLRSELAEVNPYWFVVFCDPEVLSPNAFFRNRVMTWALCRFLRPGFRHCYLMRPMHMAEGWVVMNPHSACSDIIELPWVSGLRQLETNVQNGVCRVVCVRTRRPLRWVPRVVMTCVTSVAHVIGVPSKPWTTPYDLYRYLKQEEL